MKIHLIKKETIEAFAVNNARSRPSLEEWHDKLKYADWSKPMDMFETFGTVDLLGRKSNRVVFNLGGNIYRMICKYAFGDKQVHLFICSISTHSEYDKLNINNEQYTVSSY